MNENEYYELLAKLIVSKSDVELIVSEYVENLKIDTNNKVNEKSFDEFLIVLDEYFVDLLKLCTESLKLLNNVKNEREEHYEKR